MFDTLTPAPPDPILGLTQAYKADDRPGKINLGVGVYQDANGATLVLESVRQAERRLLEEESSKSYLPIDGSPEYGRLTRELMFGSGHSFIDDGRASTSATPGGTGALRVAADFVQSNLPEATVHLPDPTWANHAGIMHAAGVPTQTYGYLAKATNALDLEAMMADLEAAPAGDVVLLHGCCHNPSGVDPDPAAWMTVAQTLRDRELLPIVDLAYQGFGDGIDADAQGLRTVVSVCPAVLICSSYSKNIGMYRERVGALTAVGPTVDACETAQSLIKQAIRRNYSNPPAHGGLVVERVLGDPELRAMWMNELEAMRSRIHAMRGQFAKGLDDRGVRLMERGNGFITEQRGMFSLTGLSREQAIRLREEFAVYIVNSGRVNVAGMTEANLPALCDAVAAVAK